MRSFPYLGSDSDNVLTGDLTGDLMSGLKKKKRKEKYFRIANTVEKIRSVKSYNVTITLGTTLQH